MQFKWLNLALALPVMFLVGCIEYGKVDQGRVVSFDKDKRTATIIRDKKGDAQAPDYASLPAVTYSLPTDPSEMGPEPKAGGRMKIDAEKSQIVIYDPATQNFKTIDIKISEKFDNVGKDNPLVKDKKFPAVDKEKKTVSIYSGRQKLLLTFTMPEEYFALPVATWDAGDEVRIYYKQDGKALRFMNISKTDIFKK